MKKWMYNVLIAIFSLVFVLSAGVLVKYYYDAYVQANRYGDLSALMEQGVQAPRPTVSEEMEKLPEEAPSQLTQVVNPETGETVALLPQFQELYLMNQDIVGWIKIPGTDIDYPVMQNKKTTDYYLKRNFDKEYSAHGCIYVRESCDVFSPSDNLTIYGHRMRDRSMFAQLDQYMKKEFWEENPYIYFDTIEQMHTYKIIGVFKTSGTIGEGFAYHEFIDAETEAEFDAFVDKVKDLSLYDTGVSAQYGEKLITLSTCEYSINNGRLVVVAKRVA